MKPVFIVVGAEKSGTTSLYHYLSQHPDIFMPPVKELNHFIHFPENRTLFQGPDVTYKNACRTRDKYAKIYENVPDGQVCGEIAHIYLYAEESAGMIIETGYTPKIIAIIRNPVDRAYAQYVFHRQFGLEPRATFEESLEEEDRRVRAGWDPVFHYVRRGFYGKQLARYYAQFPEAHIRVYKFESFFKNPSAFIQDLYEFVGVNPNFLPDVTRKFIPGGDPRAPEFISMKCQDMPGRKPMNRKTRTRLAELYKEDLREAERLTGLDLSDWLGQEDIDGF